MFIEFSFTALSINHFTTLAQFFGNNNISIAANKIIACYK